MNNNNVADYKFLLIMLLKINIKDRFFYYNKNIFKVYTLHILDIFLLQ